MEKKTEKKVSRAFFDTPEAVRKADGRAVEFEKKHALFVIVTVALISALFGVVVGALITRLVMH